MSKFELIGGVGIMGYISPMDTRDTYPVIDPIFGIDGLRNVATLQEMIDIPFERRRPGMLVGVNGGEIFYKLKNINWGGTIADWEEFTLKSDNNIDKEHPNGDIDGINTIFTLTHQPIIGSEHLYLNGLLQEEGGEDYSISGGTITFTEPPLSGSRIRCSYRY